MGFREQIVQDDMRREFRAGDLELLAAIMRAEGEVGDAGGRMIEMPAKALDMESAVAVAGYPFGPEYPFGIAIDGAAVTVYEHFIYRGGVPMKVAEKALTITGSQWIDLAYDPTADTAEYVLADVNVSNDPSEDADGFVYRSLHNFSLVDGVATWVKAGWVGSELAMMGY